MERGTKREIREFAKELYLSCDNNANHKFSVREIIEKIKEVFGKKVSERTIYYWIEKFEWDKEFEQKSTELVALALQRYKEAEKLTEEERQKIYDLLKDLWIENFLMMQQLKKIAYQSLQKELSPATAIALLRLILEYELEIEPKINIERQGEIVVRWGDGTPAWNESEG
ncbi:MAG: hypothetical protein ACP5KK_03310 [Candidatus Nanoarchaeia archaeon]